MKLSETYQAAIDVMRERGWNGHDEWGEPWGRDGSSAVCLEGALMAATGQVARSQYGAFQRCSAYLDMQEFLGLKYSLWVWNDFPYRTQEEVIAALEGARDRALEREGIAQAHEQLQREFEQVAA